MKNYILNKSPKIGQIKNASTNKNDISDYLTFNIYIQTIEKFKEKVLKNFPFYNKEKLFYLLDNLTITEMKETFYKKIIDQITQVKTLGYYNPTEHDIGILITAKKDKDLFESTLNHELLHVISQNSHSGFKTFSAVNYIPVIRGISINEGYTEYLNLKYFSQNKDSTYPIEIELAGKIEQIIGNPKVMEELYLKSDLNGLIKEISKYYPEEKINDLIKESDKLNYPYHPQKDKIISKIRNTLADIYQNKINKDYEDKKISDKEKQLQQFMNVQLYKDTGIITEEKTITEMLNSYTAKTKKETGKRGKK